MASNPGDTVLDPFCGCGTSIAASQQLKRRWIGIDITYMAIAMIENRFKTMFPGESYKTVNVPTTFYGAQALAENDKEQFEYWALRLVDARPAEGEQQRGADGGTDGVLFFRDPKTKKQARVMVQVKGGQRKNISVKDIRDLRGTMERTKSEIGLFIMLESPKDPMTVEASSAGFYKTQIMGQDYSFPRIQILTVKGLLEGIEKPQLPFGAISGLKSAEKYKANPSTFMDDMFSSNSDNEADEDEQ